MTIGQGKRRDMGWSSIHAEDLLIAAAVLAALGDRPGRAHLRKLAERMAKRTWNAKLKRELNQVTEVQP